MMSIESKRSSIGLARPTDSYNFTELPSDTFSFPTAVAVFTCVVILILFIEFGNLLTIVAFLLHRRLRRPKYIPVVSLAVSDLLFGLSTILYLIERHRNATVHDQRVFSLTSLMICNTLGDAAAWHLVVLAVDRFIAVRFPMSYRQLMTYSRIKKMTVAAWLIAALANCTYVTWIIVDAHSVTNRNTTCYQYESDDGPVPLPFDFAIQFSQFVTVSMTLTILTLGILVVVRRPHLRPLGAARHSIHGNRSIG